MLSEKRRRLWLSRIRRKDLGDLKHVRVCGRHFVSGRPSNLMDDTNPDWVPTLRLGYGSDERNAADDARFQRSKKRSEVKVLATPTITASGQSSLTDDSLQEKGSGSEEEDSSSLPPTCDEALQTSIAHAHVQTDVTMQDMQALVNDNRRLTSEVCELKREKDGHAVSEASLHEDNGKVAFYTGLLNFSMLWAIFQHVECVVKHTPQNGLPKFQEFIVFLMKLKLSLPHQDLAYRFGVSCATISRIFDKWLDASFWRLRSLITWPSRIDMQRTMPQAFFDSFGSKVAVILDCFEIRIERPSSLLPRSETWSNYKNCNTAKFLIGICPQGSISYISEGWGGRTSDKHITEHCGILDKLSPGDVILADRGFDIADSVGLYCAKLHIPAFTKGQKQLTAVDIERTRKLANVRIHVERVIGLVRNKYLVMKAIQPIDNVTSKPGDTCTPLDKIVTVCCALSNLSPSVVPANSHA